MPRPGKITLTAVPLLLLAFTIPPAIAQDAPAPTGVAGMRADLLHWIQDAEQKLLQLADATPEEKFTYRPNEEVRSTAEVFLHVAAANFGMPNFWGIKPPAGFAFQGYEKSLTRKADVEKALKDSFAHMTGALAATTDADFDKPVELFGMKTTVRGAYMLLLSHAHEHLGQSIAYARTNGIVPPWTLERQEQMKAAAGKEKADTSK